MGRRGGGVGGERWKRTEEKCSGERSVVGDWGGGREREGWNSNSKTLFYKDCSLGSVKERERRGQQQAHCPAVEWQAMIVVCFGNAGSNLVFLGPNVGEGGRKGLSLASMAAVVKELFSPCPGLLRPSVWHFLHFRLMAHLISGK